MLRTRRGQDGEWEFYDPAEDFIRGRPELEGMLRGLKDPRPWDRPLKLGRVGTWPRRIFKDGDP
jgi:hypothetical protein